MSERAVNLQPPRVERDRTKWRIVIKYKGHGKTIQKYTRSGYESEEAATADTVRFKDFVASMKSAQSIRDFIPNYELTTSDNDNDEEMVDVEDKDESSSSSSSSRKRRTSRTIHKGKQDCITKKSRKKERRELLKFNKIMKQQVCSLREFNIIIMYYQDANYIRTYVCLIGNGRMDL